MNRTVKRFLCSALILAMLVTAALPCFAQGNAPSPTVTSSHALFYGTEANLVDGVYGGYGVDDGGWLYVQTAADGTDNHVTFTVDLGGHFPVYQTGIGTIVNGWAEPMQNLTIAYSDNGADFTELIRFENEVLAAPMGHRHQWSCPEDAPVTASALRFEFDIAAQTVPDGGIHYTCIDEIDILTQPQEPLPPETEPTVPTDPVLPDSGDSVNLAAGKSYTTTWTPGDAYPDDGGQLTDGILCRTLSCKAPEWVGFYNQVNDGFDLVVDLEEMVSFEQIKMNFLREEASGIPIPTEVRIDTSDDAQNWQTLSTVEVSALSEPIGIKRFVYTIPEDKLPLANARYVRLHINFRIWLFLDEVEIFDKKTPDDGTDLSPDELPLVDLSLDVPMECSRELLYNAPSTILTDGIRADAPWNTDTWLSFNGTNPETPGNDAITMTYDLGKKVSVSQIRLGALTDSANGVMPPKTLTIELSDNGSKWTALKAFRPSDLTSGDPVRSEYLWSGDADSFTTNLPGADMVYTRYIRIRFDSTDIWCAFDELTVTGKSGKCSTAGTLLDGSGKPNLALGKTYTLSHQPNSSYPDTDGTELTDGAYGGSSLYDSAWQGHQGLWPIRSVVLDLEQTYALDEVRMSFLHSAGSGVQSPSELKIFVSDNGESWALLDGSRPNIVDDGVHTVTWKADAAPVQARFLRMDAELNGWLFFDEVEAYGTEDLTGSQKLEQCHDFSGDYQHSGSETGGIQDLVLMYNGPYKDYQGNPGYGHWSAADCKSYVAYVDESGKALDTMFDAALFLAQSSEISGNLFIESTDYGAVPSNKADWDWYLEKTVDRGGDMDALDHATAEAAQELGMPDLKMKVTIMIPFPDPVCTDFGTVNGKSVDMSVDADAQRAIDWYLDEVLARFQAAGYEHLEFSGFYWMHETNYREDIIRYTAQRVEALGYPMLWIPFYNASGWNRGEDLGFTGVALQPNHFFPEGAPSLDRIRDAATLAKMYGLGMEIECDDRLFTSVEKYNKYLDYLNGGLEYGYLSGDGSQNTVYRNWYNGIKTLMEAAKGIDPYTGTASNVARSVYDFTYQAIKGTYQHQPYRTSLEPDVRPPEETTAPTETTVPTETVTPTETVRPEETTLPSGSSTPAESSVPAPSTPNTGDPGATWLFALLMLSFAGLMVLGKGIRRST